MQSEPEKQIKSVMTKDEALKLAREALAADDSKLWPSELRRNAIAAIDAALAEPQSGMLELPEPNLPEGDWFIRDAYIKEYAKQYGRACAEAAREADKALMRKALITTGRAIDLAEFWINRENRRNMSDSEYKTWHALGYGSYTMCQMRELKDALRERLGEKE